jgi:hypothetical protein
MAIVRVSAPPSAPSASRNFAFGSNPTSSSSVTRLTPVHSEQPIIPCEYGTVGTATLLHSIPVFAPHSMKWMRDTDGKRIRSSIVKMRGLRHRPWIINLCWNGSISGTPAWWRSLEHGDCPSAVGR